MNPREEFVKGLEGAKILDGEVAHGAAMMHIGFPGETGELMRRRAMLVMLDSGLWTGLVCYPDIAGVAIQASRNPAIGPIQRSCSANW